VSLAVLVRESSHTANTDATESSQVANLYHRYAKSGRKGVQLGTWRDGALISLEVADVALGRSSLSGELVLAPPKRLARVLQIATESGGLTHVAKVRHVPPHVVTLTANNWAGLEVRCVRTFGHEEAD